jgi:hypothetical protein
MNLRETAHADIRSILSDGVFGAAWEVSLTDPDGTTDTVNGYTNDISLVIDPDTGVPVSGRSAVVSWSIADLAAAGFGIPRAVADKAVKPWRVSLVDITGVLHVFKISKSDPDRTLGIVTCTLEAYHGH